MKIGNFSRWQLPNLVKDKSEGLEEVGDEGFEPATNRLRVYSSE
ncbi:MAG: hypothetical protein V7L23_07190 [Nostoc sp.]